MNYDYRTLLGEDLYNITISDDKIVRVIDILFEKSGKFGPLFKRRLKRLLSGDQIEYALGEQTFDGREYYIDRRAYITQEDSIYFLDQLTRSCIKIYNDIQRPLNLHEIGVGSGAFMCALLSRLERNNIITGDVVASDIDSSALEVAHENFMRNRRQVLLVESDILEDFPDGIVPDLIFSYPPWGDASADRADFSGKEWEIFHRAIPQISCYSVGGETSVHEDIIDQAGLLFPKAEVHIFNDVLPERERVRITSTYSGISCERCGPEMTAFVKKRK